MARKKKTVSSVLNKAKARLAGLRSIDANIDLGNGNTAAAFDAEITKATNSMESYNTQLSLVDEKFNAFKKLERAVSAMSQTMLSAVGTKYGYNSVEYEMAGGVPKDKRKKPTPRKPKDTDGK